MASQASLHLLRDISPVLELNLIDSRCVIESLLTKEGLSLHLHSKTRGRRFEERLTKAQRMNIRAEDDLILEKILVCHDRQHFHFGLEGWSACLRSRQFVLEHNVIYYLLKADYTLGLLHSPFALMLRPHL